MRDRLQPSTHLNAQSCIMPMCMQQYFCCQADLHALSCTYSCQTVQPLISSRNSSCCQAHSCRACLTCAAPAGSAAASPSRLQSTSSALRQPLCCAGSHGAGLAEMGPCTAAAAPHLPTCRCCRCCQKQAPSLQKEAAAWLSPMPILHSFTSASSGVPCSAKS